MVSDSTLRLLIGISILVSEQKYAATISNNMLQNDSVRLLSTPQCNLLAKINNLYKQHYLERTTVSYFLIHGKT